MKNVLLMLLMGFAVTSMAQTQEPLVDHTSGGWKYTPPQPSRDIVILGPNGMGILILPETNQSRPPVSTTPPSSSQAPQTPAPNPQGK